MKPRLLCNLALPKSVDPDIDIRYNGDVAEEDQVPEPSKHLNDEYRVQRKHTHTHYTLYTTEDRLHSTEFTAVFPCHICLG